jgi:predicted Rossmann fold flavoprotein
VTKTLETELKRLRVEIRLNCEVRDLLTEKEPERRVSGVRLGTGELLRAEAVILATGGKSYPSTGSTGDGYRFASSAGHKITELSPSLVPITVQDADIPEMQGLSLKNVRFQVRDGRKTLFDDFGEMMFTHFGVTGPLILSASADLQKQIGKKPLSAEIDLKPALSEEKLDLRIVRDFEQNSNKVFRNAVSGLYPARMQPVIIRRSGIPAGKAVHDITKAERMELIRVTKHFQMTLTGLRGFQEAVITHGGVSVKEVDPSTMESRILPGLYLAGELLDVDAYTGGFNLQIAWATGHAAGAAAAASAAERTG